MCPKAFAAAAAVIIHFAVLRYILGKRADVISGNAGKVFSHLRAVMRHFALVYAADKALVMRETEHRLGVEKLSEIALVFITAADRFEHTRHSPFDFIADKAAVGQLL